MVVRVKLSDSLFPTVRCGAGANEATSFVTDTNLTIGNASVPAGAYQRLRSILDYNNQSYSVHGVSHHEGGSHDSIDQEVGQALPTRMWKIRRGLSRAGLRRIPRDVSKISAPDL